MAAAVWSEWYIVEKNNARDINDWTVAKGNVPRWLRNIKRNLEN